MNFNNDINYYTLKMSNNMPIETQIDMFIPFIQDEDKAIISRTHPAILQINNDKFSISYGDYIELFDIQTARDVYELKESYDYNCKRFFEFLDSIDCKEMVDLSIDDINNSRTVYFIKDYKLMKIEDGNEPGYGWKEVGENTYCLCPLLDYIIWGSIYDGPIKILKY